MKSLVLERLRWSDWAFARALAAAPDVRARSLDGRPPTSWRHLCWMWRHTASARHAGYVAWWRGGLERCGVLTLRGEVRWVEIGVAVPTELRGHGLGAAIVRLGCGEAVRIWGPEVRVVAIIKEDNPASLRVFTKARFRVSDELGTPRPGTKEYLWTL